MFLYRLFDFFSPSFSFADENAPGGSYVTEEDEDETPSEESQGSEETEEEVVTIGGKQYKASELLGSDGIPRVKNLQIELERKTRELKEKDDLLKGIVRPAPQVDVAKQLDIAIAAVKTKYPDLSDDQIKPTIEISQSMVQAQRNARASIAAEYFVDRAKSAIKDSDDKSTLEKWSDEVNEALTAMPLAWKTTPQNATQAVRNALDVIKGRHVKDIIKDAQEGLKRPEGVRPRDTSVIGGGGSKVPKGTASQGIGLTESQKTDQQKMGNISETEYKGLLKKAQERDKTAGRPVRQTLN